MIREKLPENREEAFIAEEHFPSRLDELERFAGEVRAEFLVPEPFPRVEFETVGDGLVVEVNEAEEIAVPADVLDEDRFRLHAGLFAGVAEVENGLLVFVVFLDVAEMNRLPGPATPRFDEAFVEGIELVGVGPCVL